MREAESEGFLGKIQAMVARSCMACDSSATASFCRWDNGFQVITDEKSICRSIQLRSFIHLKQLKIQCDAVRLSETKAVAE